MKDDELTNCTRRTMVAGAGLAAAGAVMAHASSAGASESAAVGGKTASTVALDWKEVYYTNCPLISASNVDQELGRKDVVAFFRFGYGDDDVTPVKIFVSGGVAFEAPFGREGDLVAIGVAWSDPSPDVGFRSETLLELFYRVEFAKAISITPDLQLVFNPANNLDDEVVVVPGIRLHLKF